MNQQDEPQMDSQDILQMLQQKIGNLELTVHAMMNVLEVDQDELNKEAQNIVQEMQDISQDEIEEEIQERVNQDDET